MPKPGVTALMKQSALADIEGIKVALKSGGDVDLG